jgi:hypothetical protein
MLPRAGAAAGAGAREVVVLDCRNAYESDLGRFEGARPLGTATFKDSWPAVDAALQGPPCPAPSRGGHVTGDHLPARPASCGAAARALRRAGARGMQGRTRGRRR